MCVKVILEISGEGSLRVYFLSPKEQFSCLKSHSTGKSLTFSLSVE